MSLTRRMLIAWMVAVTVHLPFPVCDGDNLRSWECATAASQTTEEDIDIDLVLLGCDLPDDVDDGPVDDDPEGGSGSFGAYFTAKAARSSQADLTEFQSLSAGFFGNHHILACQIAKPSLGTESVLDTDHAFGMCGQNGRPVLRC